MPAGFDNCVKGGGSVKTINGPDKRYGLAAGEYCHVCLLRGNWFRGETKQKQKQKQKQGQGQDKKAYNGDKR